MNDLFWLDDTEIFSVLHVDLDAFQSPNLNFSARKNVFIYIRCAILLAKTLSKSGCKLNLYTNSPHYILDIQPNILKYLNLIKLECEIVIPKNLIFYSAHQKISAYGQVSENAATKFGMFLDLDCVVFDLNFIEQLKLFNFSFLNLFDQQSISYGEEVVFRTLNRISGSKFCKKIWVGGEFIFAEKHMLKSIHQACVDNLSSYLDNIHGLHHVGDEALMTGSIATTDICLHEVNLTQLNVARIWSVHVGNDFLGIAGLRANIIHLPADKILLMCFSYIPFNKNLFKFTYFIFYYFRKCFSYVKANLIKIVRRQFL